MELTANGAKKALSKAGEKCRNLNHTDLEARATLQRNLATIAESLPVELEEIKPFVVSGLRFLQDLDTDPDINLLRLAGAIEDARQALEGNLPALELRSPAGWRPAPPTEHSTLAPPTTVPPSQTLVDERLEATAPTPDPTLRSASDPAPDYATDPATDPALDYATDPVTDPAPDYATDPATDALELSPLLDPELFNIFLFESYEHVESAEAALLMLEVDPTDQEAVNTLFRAFHTLKSGSGLIGHRRASALAHRAESLFERVRDRTLVCTSEHIDLALRSVDLLKSLISSSSAATALGTSAMADYDHLMERLHSAAKGPDPSSAGAPASPGMSADMHGMKSEEPPTHLEPSSSKPADSERERPSSTDLQAAASSESFIRVRTARLDQLIDIVGELVIAQSMVSQDNRLKVPENLELQQKALQVSKLMRDLQELSMAMRMIPLKATFQKMNRVARDVAFRTGKQVEFVMVGEDTEIDRNMVDVIGDPLMHMVRNAVDHGIEVPGDREARGKPPVGSIRLSARHEGGNVLIELQDDGRGLDRDKIVRTAVKRGLIEPDRVMTDAEIFGLIFEPGFSTAEKITDVSGRGVGLELVRHSIESLHGRVELTSEPGHGTRFTVQLPLTLAITEGMLVRVGSERYVIPMVSIRKIFRPSECELFSIAQRGEMVRLRDENVPLLRLHRLFGVAASSEDAVAGLLIVIQSVDRRIALLVDELVGQQQVVAKTLGGGLGLAPGLAGAAILGDGRIGLILDAAGLCAAARQQGSSIATRTLRPAALVA